MTAAAAVGLKVDVLLLASFCSSSRLAGSYNFVVSKYKARAVLA